jgi:hypothetical protein
MQSGLKGKNLMKHQHLERKPTRNYLWRLRESQFDRAGKPPTPAANIKSFAIDGIEDPEMQQLVYDACAAQELLYQKMMNLMASAHLSGGMTPVEANATLLEQICMDNGIDSSTASELGNLAFD